MSTGQISGVDSRRGLGTSRDVGELDNLQLETSFVPISRIQLLPGEEAASLLAPSTATPYATAALTRFLGPVLTVANPAWSGDPVPRMRMLQKRLVEHSLTLPEDDRSECMGAIMVVEKAVKLRLRLQQMEMTLAELNAQPENVQTP
jgi:hypothetical protein